MSFLPFLQVVSTPSWQSLVCAWSVSTLSSIMVLIKSQATWPTLLDSMSGWRQLCRKLLRTWRRLRFFFNSDLRPACWFLTFPPEELGFKLNLLLALGLHHSPCAGGVPAVCQKHHCYERRWQREAGLHLQAVQSCHCRTILRPHAPWQHHGAARSTR